MAVLAFWVLPIVLGVRAAKRNNRSPHWMWFGVHPFGAWIAFFVLQFSAPLKSCRQCGERVKAYARICPYCTTPFPEGAAPPSLPVSSRKRALWISALVLACALGMTGFVLFVSGMVESSFKDSGGYQQAIAKASSDPRVIQVLGEPITAGHMSSGSISTMGDSSGEADLAIPISGPKGAGRLYVIGKMRAGVWTFSTLEVAPEGGAPRIDLTK